MLFPTVVPRNTFGAPKSKKIRIIYKSIFKTSSRMNQTRLGLNLEPKVFIKVGSIKSRIIGQENLTFP
jgi:hypothetical protein